MHCKWVQEVERLILLLEELLQLIGKVERGVDAQDLGRDGVVPAREEGHLEPSVAFLRCCVLRTVVMRGCFMGFGADLVDHLHEASEPC
jgi:hypothetical protein